LGKPKFNSAAVAGGRRNEPVRRILECKRAPDIAPQGFHRPDRRPRWQQRRLTIVAALGFGIWLAGIVCGPAAAAEEIQYRLKWIYNASVVGDLVAQRRGFFRQQGLQVSIKEGGPERDAIRELEMGRAQFGVASADQVIRALSKGAEVVVISQLFQINPLQWIYRPDFMTVTSPSDLRGKTLGVTFGGNDETILRALLAGAGLSVSDVTLYSVRPDFTPFYRKKVNFWPVYRNTQAVFLSAKLRQAGEDFAFFNPADYGVRFVANSVITSRRILENRPALANRFRTAVLQGWQAALEPANLEKAVATLQHYGRNLSPETLRRQIEITRTLVQPDRRIPIGAIDIAAWKQTERIMLGQGLIDSPVEVQTVLDPPWRFEQGRNSPGLAAGTAALGEVPRTRRTSRCAARSGHFRTVHGAQFHRCRATSVR